jgi:hypothetical protein
MILPVETLRGAVIRDLSLMLPTGISIGVAGWACKKAE